MATNNCSAKIAREAVDLAFGAEKATREKTQREADRIGSVLSGACDTTGPCRQDARSSLRDRAWRLRREADRIDRLLGCLPTELPHDVEQALWDLISGVR